MSSPISLSEIQQWKPDDLNALAAHFGELADRRGNTMDAIQSSANNLEWTGAGNVGMKTAIAGHAATADSQAQILRATATVAKDGGNLLYGQQQGILKTAQQAQSAGFQVSDALLVTDATYPPGSIPWAARQGIAEGIQADLMTQAAAFTGQRMATAAGITSSAAGLTGTSAADSKSGVSMLDNKFKMDGGGLGGGAGGGGASPIPPGINGQPPTGKTATDLPGLMGASSGLTPQQQQTILGGNPSTMKGQDLVDGVQKYVQSLPENDPNTAWLRGQVSHLQQHVDAIDYAQNHCTAEDWTSRTTRFAAGLVTTGIGVGTAETGLGLIAAGAGATGTYFAGTDLLKCLTGGK